MTQCHRLLKAHTHNYGRSVDGDDDDGDDGDDGDDNDEDF